MRLDIGIRRSFSASAQTRENPVADRPFGFEATESTVPVAMPDVRSEAPIRGPRGTSERLARIGQLPAGALSVTNERLSGRERFAVLTVGDSLP